MSNRPLPRVRPAIEKMQPYHPPLEGRTGLRLDFNENTQGCSPAVLEALHSATAEDLARYPEYSQGESEIAASFGHTPESMVLTNGVDDAILLAVETFVDRGDEVVFVEPTFSMYRFYSQQAEAVLRPQRYLEAEIAPGAAEFRLDMTALRAAVTGKTRMVFVASPNNPTGTLADGDELVRLAEDFPNLLVFVDEAYADFVSEENRGLLDEVLRLPNLLVARTFSKAYGLAGLRLGALFAHPAMTPTLRKAHPPYNVNMLAVICGRAAVRERGWVSNYRRETIASRGLIEEALERLGIPYWKSYANFVLFQAGAHASTLLREFRANGILLRDRRADYPGAVRITCGTVEQTKTAITLLEGTWKRLAASPAPPVAAEKPWLVFDMDGVLVEVRDSYRRAIRETVFRLGGGEVAPEEVQALKNQGGFNNDWDLTQEILRRRGKEFPYAQIVAAFNQVYRGDNGNGLIQCERWLLPTALLEQLQQYYRLAIYTGRPREDAEFVLRRFAVTGYFEKLLAMEDVERGKPDPEGLLCLGQQFAPARMAAYIGDTVDDARCARSAGVAFLGVLPSDHLSFQVMRQLFEKNGSLAVRENVAQVAQAVLAGEISLERSAAKI